MVTQISAIWAVTRKDLALWIRRPSIIGVTVFPPLILLLVLVLQAVSVTSEPVAIVNQDTGAAATALQNIATSYDGFSSRVEPAASASSDYRDLRVAAVLTIPKGFSAAAAQRQHPAVLWHVRNFNADSANDLERSMADVLTQFMATGAVGHNPIHLATSEKDQHASDAGFVGFQLIAVLVMLLMQAGLINAGLAAALEWRTGRASRYRRSGAASAIDNDGRKTSLKWQLPSGFIRSLSGIGKSYYRGGERRFRAMPERHDMVRVGRGESGAEEWSCPKCGHRLLLRLPPPRFEVIVLAEGDTTAAHTGTRCGPARPPEEISPTVSEEERRWLHTHGIAWDN